MTADARRHTICIIDRCKADIRWFQLMAEEAGLRVDLLRFESDIEALRALRLVPVVVDLLLLGVRPLTLSITELVHELRAIPALASVPVAVAIGSDSDRFFLGDDLPHDGLVAKPLSAGAVRDLLGGPKHVAALGRTRARK